MAGIKLSELGLAEFVAGLISETFEALSASMADQLTRQTDLIRAAELDVETYGRQHIDAAAIEQACLALFGDAQGQNPITAGKPYLPGEPETEMPAIRQALGLALQEGVDYRKDDESGWVLAPAGIDRIRLEIRTQLARNHQEALRMLLNKGLPRVSIDSGRILAKVTFDLTETTSVSTPVESTTTVAPQPVRVAGMLNAAAFQSKLLNRLSATRTNLLLPNTQLKVKPASDDTAQSSSKSVYGEVEITFKTVS